MLSLDLTDAWSHLDSPIHRLDARVKLLSSMVLVMALLVVPAAGNGVLAAYGGLLAVTAFASRLPAVWILKRLVILAPFLIIGTVGVALLPPIGAADAWQLGGLELSSQAVSVWLSIGGKCLLCLMVSVLLVGTATSADLVAAAQGLRVPRTITALVGFAVTYVEVLLDEARRMVTAMRSRGTPSGVPRKLRTAASMATTLMSRTLHRAERISLAMVSRGYTGRMPALKQEPVSMREWAVVAAVVVVAVGLTWTGVIS